jgi:hypothetical protein
VLVQSSVVFCILLHSICFRHCTLHITHHTSHFTLHTSPCTSHCTASCHITSHHISSLLCRLSMAIFRTNSHPYSSSCYIFWGLFVGFVRVSKLSIISVGLVYRVLKCNWVCFFSEVPDKVWTSEFPPRLVSSGIKGGKEGSVVGNKWEWCTDVGYKWLISNRTVHFHESFLYLRHFSEVLPHVSISSESECLKLSEKVCLYNDPLSPWMKMTFFQTLVVVDLSMVW